MKLFALLAFICGTLGAQTLTFAIHDNTGVTPDVPLPATYQFAPTAVGSASTVMIKATNTGNSPVQVNLIYVGAAAGTPIGTPDFTATGFDQDHTLAPGASEYFSLNFTPTSSGALTGYLQVSYEVGTSYNSQAISTLQGNGTASQLTLTYNNGSGNNIALLPDATSRLDFGSVAASATVAITFTLTNQTSNAISTPAVSINAGVYTSSAFSLNSSALPAMLPANGSGTFTVTFAPGQTGLTTADLTIGNNDYGLEGTGIVVTPIDALQIYYVDSTGVRTEPQAATAINFGQLVPGTSGGMSLKFTVTNPQTSFDPVTVSTISVSGSAYTVSGVPTLPVTIQPNSSVTFTVTFSASVSGTFTGSLAIGSRTFNLTGLSVVSPAPSMSLQLSEPTLTSAQQVNVTVQAASPASQEVLCTLTMAFAPSVANITDDPAVVFLTTGGRSLSLDLAKGAQTATYQGQSALAFQTGTTAGALTFTLSIPNTPPLTQSYTITPAQIHITNATAVRSDPNLVVTVNGYDNTYSAGQLAFTFYDTKGNALNTTPMTVDATEDFHQYFFTNDVAGGSFALQATFPVKGDVTQIGAVSVTLNNSAGQDSTKLAFQ